jgi:hypothetical protein
MSPIGTKLPSGDVRAMVAIEGKADILRSAQKGRERPEAVIWVLTTQPPKSQFLARRCYCLLGGEETENGR